MDTYSTEELREKIASHDYSAELCLQHAMLNIEQLEKRVRELKDALRLHPVIADGLRRKS